jgi:hypothetical protein
MKEAIAKLEAICAVIAEVSGATQGRPTDWRGEQASLAFAKFGITCITFLRLIPGSKYFGPADRFAVWDLSSAASLCRNLIEAYHLLVYLIHEPKDDPTKKFQQNLWEYHEQHERYAMMQAGVPGSKHLASLAAELAARRQRLEANPVFQKLPPKMKGRLTNAEKFKLESHDDLTRLAGISEKYFRSQYRYCSAFSHSAPFAISQLGAFKAGSPEAIPILRSLVQVATGYAAMALRDSLVVFPDQQSSLPAEVQEIVELWKGILKWETSPCFAPRPWPHDFPICFSSERSQRGQTLHFALAGRSVGAAVHRLPTRTGPRPPQSPGDVNGDGPHL